MGRGAVLSGPVLLLIGTAGGLASRVFPAASHWVTGVFLLQAAVAAWMLTARLSVLLRCLLAAVAVGATALAIRWLGLPAHAAGVALTGTCHAIAYASLFFWFLTSLRPGREAVVTGFARQMRRTMPPEVVGYTRSATAAWCVFFAAQLLTSCGLLIAAPEAVWASFVTVWNVPLIAAMALAEFATRAIVFRRHQRTGAVATLMAMRHVRIMPGGRP